jgi:hypothetical protein
MRLLRAFRGGPGSTDQLAREAAEVLQRSWPE